MTSRQSQPPRIPIDASLTPAASSVPVVANRGLSGFYSSFAVLHVDCGREPRRLRRCFDGVGQVLVLAGLGLAGRDGRQLLVLDQGRGGEACGGLVLRSWLPLLGLLVLSVWCCLRARERILVMASEARWPVLVHCGLMIQRSIRPEHGTVILAPVWRLWRRDQHLLHLLL